VGERGPRARSEFESAIRIRNDTEMQFEYVGSMSTDMYIIQLTMKMRVLCICFV